MKRTAIFILLLGGLVGCSDPKPSAVGLDLISLYVHQDSLALTWLVRDDHYQLRRKLDTLLAEVLNARTDNDTVSTDTLRPALVWLCDSYARASGLADKNRMLASRLSWSPEELRLKRSLDSAYAETSKSKSKENATGSDSGLPLLELRAGYEKIGDTFSMTSVDYSIAEDDYNAQEIDSAHVRLKRCAEMSLKVDDLERAAYCELLMSRILTLNEADFLGSEQAILRASGYFERLGNYLRMADAPIAQAFNLTLLFQTDKAIDNYHTGYVISSKYGNRRQQAYCLYGIGENYYLEGRLDSATCYTKQAWQRRKELAAEFPRLRVDEACAESSVGQLAQAAGNIDEALERYSHADRLLQDCDDLEMLCTNRLRLAMLLTSQGEYDRAREYYRTILDTSIMYENSVNAQFGLAVCDYYQGNKDAAVANLERCIHRQEISRAKLPIPSLTTGMLWDKLGYYRLLSVILLERYHSTDNPAWRDSAFQYVEASKAMALTDMIRSGPDTSNCEVATGLVERISAHENDLLSCRGDSATHIAVIRALEDSLHSEQIRAAGQSAIASDPAQEAPVSIAEIQRLLNGVDAALLSYLISDYGSYVFVLTKDLISVEKLDFAVPAMDSTIHAFVGAISNYPSGYANDSLWRTCSRRLYEYLIPHDALRTAGKKRLIVIGDGHLGYLPFEALVDDQGRYLVESYDVSYAPSARTLTIPEESRGGNTHGRGAVVFADPSFSDSGIIALPFTRDEATRIAEALGRDNVTLFQNFRANETAFREQDYGNVRYVHVATHALCDERRPDRSALLLAGDPGRPETGLVTRDELMTMRVPSDLVFLSACKSATGRSYPGEGVLGLAQAFLVAGSRSVIASYWSVNDRATADLVGSFYTGLAAGLSEAAALTQAKRTMIASERPLYRHPYFWAPFVLIGQAN